MNFFVVTVIAKTDLRAIDIRHERKPRGTLRLL
jgi:hypothetical protein